ncbi:hypothetical protein EVAR_37284_1 [Eumeta japonica]|uniref:Uncharacterized protein n=1 Tax=Eumeta variegata TaxID=151549 RepID=A0A4C1WJ55_EUMVA|nr:hypothetical protein EVAR_37284_1 [Eumeta japonica]
MLEHCQRAMERSMIDWYPREGRRNRGRQSKREDELKLTAGPKWRRFYNAPHNTDVVFSRRRRRTSLIQIVNEISATTFNLVNPLARGEASSRNLRQYGPIDFFYGGIHTIVKDFWTAVLTRTYQMTSNQQIEEQMYHLLSVFQNQRSLNQILMIIYLYLILLFVNKDLGLKSPDGGMDFWKELRLIYKTQPKPSKPSTSGKRGRPSYELENAIEAKKLRGPIAIMPSRDVRLDQIDHISGPLDSSAKCQNVMAGHMLSAKM